MSRVSALQAEAPSLPSHLISLHGEDWTIWRRMALRSAGFPADMILRLSSPGCAAAAERLLDAEERLAAATEAAVAAVRSGLDDLAASGAWEDRERRQLLLDLLRALKKGKVPPAAEPVVGASLLAGLRRSREDHESLAAALRRAHAAEEARTAEEIHRIARLERFQEAVLWQNRAAFHTAVRKVAEEPPAGAPGSRRAQHESLIVKYLQRYSAKNDTIGFFGPCSWASFADEEGIEVRPGAGLLALRDVYLEAWGLDEVAKALARDFAVRRWQRPQRLPVVRVVGTTLYHLMAPPAELTPAEVALLAACDGKRTALAIAADLLADPALGLASEEEVYQALARFDGAGVVDWSFDVPIHPFARDVLQAQFEEIGEESERAACLAALGEMERCRRAVAAAAGDAAALDRAIGETNATFSRLTGLRPTRREGETYGGRTLVYEDCLREVEVSFGPEMVQALGEPLSLLLLSARWFTARMAEGFREAARRIYGELTQAMGPAVGVAPFWQRLQPLLIGDRRELVLGPVLAELHARWHEILGVEPGQRRLQLSSADLRERVQEVFATDAPGWRMARQHSPDVMIAAAGAEALRRGDYQLVLGEIHLGRNTLNSWVFMAQQPEREELFGWMDEDLPLPLFLIGLVRDSAVLNTRTQYAYERARDFLVPPADRAMRSPRSQVIPAAELVVQDTPEGLRLGTRDGRLAFDIAESVGQFLSHGLTNPFGLLAEGEHWPRITIDRMVVRRESWTFPAEALAFAAEKEAADRFLGARRWARQNDFPRFVFVRVPTEQKPIYVDLDSAALVELLAKMVRQAQQSTGRDRAVRVSEMLPTPEQTWLHDAEGRRYTSELRMVVIDRSAWRG